MQKNALAPNNQWKDNMHQKLVPNYKVTMQNQLPTTHAFSTFAMFFIQ